MRMSLLISLQAQASNFVLFLSDRPIGQHSYTHS
jgi:hypothetical protein